MALLTLIVLEVTIKAFIYYFRPMAELSFGPWPYTRPFALRMLVSYIKHTQLKLFVAALKIVLNYLPADTGKPL
jgi:hypothetical protein